MKEKKGIRTALLVVGLLLACLAESSGAVLLVAMVGSGVAFSLLLVLSIRGEARQRDASPQRREITISLPKHENCSSMFSSSHVRTQ